MAAKIIQGDCRTVMTQMKPESVQCVVTSPPYWGLRDYKLPDLDWGGWKGSLGLEPQPELYIQHLVEVFRGVRRVLRDDGVIFLNLGDSYDSGNLVGMPWRVAFALQADGWWLRSAVIWAKGMSFCDAYSGSVMPESVNGVRWERCKTKVGGKGSVGPTPSGWDTQHESNERDGRYDNSQASLKWQPCPGCDKCRESDGYVLRWCAGRPTSAHEMVFLLAKSPHYFYDADAVREAHSQSSIQRYKYPRFGPKNKAMTGEYAIQPGDYTEAEKASSGRNLRNVWAINPENFADGHFATFPTKLIEPCVRAGTSPKACAECGAAYARVIETSYNVDQSGNGPRGDAQRQPDERTDLMLFKGSKLSNTIGWRPTCACGTKETKHCLVLDPFAGGSGRVGIVCKRLGRDFVGIELSQDYVAMSEKHMAKPVTAELFE